MQEIKETMELDFQLQALQEMEIHPAWALFREHLDRLCRLREVEKSKALRSNDSFTASKKQFEIDGITLAAESLKKMIISLSPETEKPGQ